MNYTNKNYTSKGKSWAPQPENVNNYNPKPKYSATGTKKSESVNKNDFFSAMENTQSCIYDVTRTENGAIVHSTSGSKLLDMNFAVTQLRGKTDKEICEKFRAAYNEDPLMAMKWLFYAYDVREGIGERNLFRACMIDLARNGQTALVNSLMSVIPKYGRWDMILNFLDTRCKTAALKTIKAQCEADTLGMKNNKPISLMYKWLPSEQASSADSRRYASIIMKYLNMSPRNYRKMLSNGRKYIDVVERKMSSNNWQSIDYETVPSKANLSYNNAFLRHDEDRRRLYLGALEKGQAKINSSVSFPYEIVNKYIKPGYSRSVAPYDAALEGMWKALPNLVNNNESTLVVCDGSGSMLSTIPNTKISCLTVAQALAIYFAERCSGAFKDKFITFSSNPKLINLGDDYTLRDKICEIKKYDECSNTNIEAVFDLVLNTAIRNHMRQEDIPANILIISDMQFDGAVCCNSTINNWRGGIPSTLFNTIANKFASAGYKMPRLIFWNLNCRSTKDTVPVRENENGVALVSGFSVNICKMVMSNKTDPYECLLEAINVPRYNEIESICKKVWKAK